jgi:hypothetical protein
VKICCQCKQEKALDSFYNDKNSKDGKGRLCKVCRAINGRNEQSKRSLYNKEYKKRDYVKEKDKNKFKKLRKKKDIRSMARAILQKNVARLSIKKPSKCSICLENFNENKIQGHHEDYTKPLDVIWCCRLCHEKLHKKVSKYIG